MEFTYDNATTVRDVGEGELKHLKAHVNHLRNEIGKLDREGKINIWNVAAHTVNPYELLKFQGPRVISRAYYKMYEILHRYRLLDGAIAPFHTTHLCEAPGAFIQATEDYWKFGMGSPEPLDWYGVTLKEGLGWTDGGLLRNFSADRILYADVIKETLPSCASNSWIVTGDGGFEIKGDDRNQQEELNTPLLSAQIEQSFKLLSRGGHMVIKMFDMYTEETARLLWKCQRRFRLLKLIKPLGSRICNSEK
jgi:23S rRNA U2552 (ribose-2'-O)-methylase RlmE/FtsJ